MPLATYADLKAAIADFLMRDDLAAAIPTFVALAEERIANTLRVSQMEVTVVATMVDGAVALPDDFIEARRIIGEAPHVRYLEPITPGQASDNYGPGNAGVPGAYTITGNVLTTYPSGGSGSVTMVYYARPPALSDTMPTNWLLQRSPGIYLYGALMDSAPYLGDDARLQVWAALYQKAVDGLQSADNRARYGSSVMRVRGHTP